MDHKKFTIRPVALSDTEHWKRLRSELWPDGVNEHEREIASFFAGKVLEPDAVFVAIDTSDQLIGFVELSVRNNVPGLERRNVGFIEGLYVTPSMRHCGVALALVRTSRAWTESEGCVGFASDRSGRYVVDKHFSG